MSLLVSLILIGFQISGVRAVSISEGSGDVYIHVKKDLRSTEVTGKFLQFRNDTMVILNSWSRTISISVPEGISITVKSVSGDVEIYGNYLKSIDIASISGDARVDINHSDSIEISTQTGNIYLRYGDTAGVIDIHSRTGDIVYKGKLFDNLWIHSGSGDIEIYTSGSTEGFDFSKITSKFGDVEIYNRTTDSYKVLTGSRKVEVRNKEKNGLKRLNVLSKFKRTKNLQKSFIPFSTWERYPIEFTKVDGFTLNIPFGESSNNDFYSGYIGYSFSAKRVDFYLHGFKEIYNPVFLYFRLFNERRTPDAWKLSSGENTLSSILLHEDFADFYHSTGFGAFTGVNLKSSWIMAGIEGEQIENLLNKTEWSLFFRDSRTYTPNRPIKEGKLEFLKIEGYLNPVENVKLRAEFERQISSNYPKFNRVFISGSISIKLVSGLKIVSNMTAGYSPDKLDSPFDFRIGGPFTLPGFRWKEFHGDKWMALINTFVLFNISDDTFFLRFDGGRTNFMSAPKFDSGIGVMFDDFYLGVAYPVSNFQGNPNLFAGLRRSF